MGLILSMFGNLFGWVQDRIKNKNENKRAMFDRREKVYKQLSEIDKICRKWISNSSHEDTDALQEEGVGAILFDNALYSLTSERNYTEENHKKLENGLDKIDEVANTASFVFNKKIGRYINDYIKSYTGLIRYVLQYKAKMRNTNMIIKKMQPLSKEREENIYKIAKSQFSREQFHEYIRKIQISMADFSKWKIKIENEMRIC